MFDKYIQNPAIFSPFFINPQAILIYCWNNKLFA